MSRNIAALLRFAAAITLVLLTATHAAWGQGAVTNGTITGDVHDASGAMVPAAKVTAQNQATGLHRDTVADANGHFVLSQLPAGRYQVSVTSAGFKESVVHDFQLNVDATAYLKFTLSLGSVEQKVDVSADAAQVAIDVSKAEISNVIQEIQVRELPINQRSFTALVTQQPGLVTMTNTSNAQLATPTSVAYSQGSQISANGMGSQSMAYMVDGVNINNSGYGAPGTAAGGDIPGVEGIQEFKVLSMNYSAAYGGSAGAVVSFATRGGSNSFHGGLYEFLRNNKLDAREYFNNQGPQNPYKRNQFGGTFGGPIRKDKTFFFTNYEALRSRLTTSNVATVPSLDARNGGSDGTSGFKVFDPWNNEVAIPEGVKAILNLYPLPNGEDLGYGTAFSTFPNYHPVNQHYGLFKLDQVLSSKDTLMTRYSITDARGYNSFSVPAFNFDQATRLQGLALKWTRVISTNLVNTASISLQRSLTNAAVTPTVEIPPIAFTGNIARGLLGGISVGSGGVTSGALSTIGQDTWGPFRGANNTLPINDDLIYTHGNHTLKIGGQIVPHQWNWDKGDMPGGNWVFQSLNDFLAGYPSTLFILQDGAVISYKYRNKQFAWYVEDSWRLKSNLTLTLGLRHDFQSVLLSEIHDPSRLGNVLTRDDPTATTGDAALGPNPTKKQFAPRIGISWDPLKDGKTVIRSGFGMFYDFLGLEAFAGHITYNAPNPALDALFGPTLIADWHFRGTKDNPVIPPIPFPACSTCTLPNGGPTGYVGVLTSVIDVHAPTSLQWNLQIERELPAGFKLSAAYQGSHSYHIIRGLEENTSKPCSFVNGQPYFGRFKGDCGVTAPLVDAKAFELYGERFDGQAKYNAATFSVTKKMASGVSFSSSYTFAKAMSNTDSVDLGASMVGNAGHSQWPDNPMNDWSESQYSIRHRFVTNGVFELPFGQGKKFAGDAKGLKQVLLGGWALNPMLEVRGGIPFSVLAGVGITNVGDIAAVPDRPNMIRSNAVLGGIKHYFDPKAFWLQDPGYLGNAPRNSVRGPGFTEVDLSLTKQFKTSERTSLQLRIEAFNLINHPNFDLPFNQVYTPSGGDTTTCNMTPSALDLNVSCNRLAGAITRIVGTPREIQLALKFTF